MCRRRLAIGKATDLPVEEQVKKTAGARGYVSRSYKNAITGEVGYGLADRRPLRKTSCVTRPTCAIRRPVSRLRAPENSLQSFVFDGKDMGDFYTNTFVKEDAAGRQLIRVFWSWYKPNGRRHRRVEGAEDRALGIRQRAVAL